MDPIYNEQQPIKRPVGMTILLVLSLLNAIYQSLSSAILYIFSPTMKEMLDNGMMEESLRQFAPTMDNTMFEAMMENVSVQLAVNPVYYLIMFVLFIGSLTGVVLMFKLQRLGFHIYSISQMLMLIANVVYVVPNQVHNTFFNEFLITLMFILIYHIYLKRVELQAKMKEPKDPMEP